MKVIITQTAEDSLEGIYRYKYEYSVAHADEFLSEIYGFTTDNLSEFPRLGHVYNSERGLFRLIYAKAFNIYYTIRVARAFCPIHYRRLYQPEPRAGRPKGHPA